MKNLFVLTLAVISIATSPLAGSMILKMQNQIKPNHILAKFFLLVWWPKSFSFILNQIYRNRNWTWCLELSLGTTEMDTRTIPKLASLLCLAVISTGLDELAFSNWTVTMDWGWTVSVSTMIALTAGTGLFWRCFIIMCWSPFWDPFWEACWDAWKKTHIWSLIGA